MGAHLVKVILNELYVIQTGYKTCAAAKITEEATSIDSINKDNTFEIYLPISNAFVWFFFIYGVRQRGGGLRIAKLNDAVWV